MDELTAVENVELPALLAGMPSRRARRAATALLDDVGLADRERHRPAELSGGQKQRVAIARALVNRPTVLLADEPTGNLDSAATTEVLRLFDRLRADGQTLVVVTHDQRTAATADRMVSMRDGVLVDDVGTALRHDDPPSRSSRRRPRVSRLRLGLRLAARDLRRRATETVLLFLALVVAATTLTIGLVLHGQTAAPYAETRQRTDGPDVVAVLFPAPNATVTAADRARAPRRRSAP